ncbi:response regulator transcription factor [Sulfurovum sp. bin170]|uniref:response regulator transcription factor n=1 Tax=Sulfurovum sp. bin170 TaxID=2695268 RepID=UPI0013DF1B96|nr:response regulator transcription factor [Sulfurovum sp. bin170]NEW60516.1 response regulator transcription factor [Sulfurovum sp. bin170]
MKRLGKMTILYVEDEEQLIRNYAPFLEEHCQSLYIARDGEEAYRIYREYRPNIILLDIYIPKMSGVELARKIRVDDYTTVLIAFTAHSDRKTLLEFIDLHLLSYLVKPVSRSVLISALVKAAQKVYGEHQVNLPFNCSWDSKSQTLYHDREQVSLTKRERSFFDLMIKKQGVPCADDEIILNVWSDKYDEAITNTSIRTLIKNLRKKVPTKLIKNQYGVGYKLEL